MAHTASLSQLQQPRWALVDGELVPWSDVRIHIGAEALTRALSVFEGVKGYWDTANEVFSIRSPQRHYDRLCRSARLLHIPISFSGAEYESWLVKLGRELLIPERDLWFRTTLYVTEGHWGEGTVAQLVITAYTQTKQPADPMRIGVSTWRRGNDATMPARIKSAANYVIGRVARIEVGRLGYDEAVLLNEAGRVAEATGACLLIADSDGIVTPPASEGCLDSITVDALEEIAIGMGVSFRRRPLDRTELLTARECALAGTITDLTPVSEVDGQIYDTSGVLADLRRRYLAAMRGEAAMTRTPMVALLRLDPNAGVVPVESDIVASNLGQER